MRYVVLVQFFNGFFGLQRERERKNEGEIICEEVV